MAGENVTIDATCSQEYIANSPPEVGGQSPEGGERRLCPLCQSPVRLFFIHFNDKFLMCENTQCEFPFGYEELKITTTTEGTFDEDSVSNVSRTKTSGITGSIISSKSSDVDKLNKIIETEEFQTERVYCSQITKPRPQDSEKLMKNIKDIKELNRELYYLNSELEEKAEERSRFCDNIKNQRWIKNLKNLQEISGVQLLKPEEINFLKKEEPVLGLGELKIDISPGNVSNVSSIRIEIHNTESVEQNGSMDDPITIDNPNGKDPLPV